MKYLYIFVLFLIASCDVTKLSHGNEEVTSSDAQPIQFWSYDCDTYNQKETCGVHSKCFYQPWNCDDELPFQFTDTVENQYTLLGFNTDDEEVLRFELDVTAIGSIFIYTISFVPSEQLDVCNELVRFVVSDSSSPETYLLKSDFVNFKNSHPCTIVVEYSNNRNFAGLVYENVSPVQTFRILAQAIFFHERFPEEDNVIELTNSIIKTSGQLKSQRLFETDYLPYYMHKKYKLVLKHQTVLIDNAYWTKEESYDIQDGERRWPVKKGKCFLTEKNYVQRDVL